MSVMKSCSSWKYMMLNMCKNNRSGEKKKKKTLEGPNPLVWRRLIKNR